MGNYDTHAYSSGSYRLYTSIKPARSVHAQPIVKHAPSANHHICLYNVSQRYGENAITVVLITIFLTECYHYYTFLCIMSCHVKGVCFVLQCYVTHGITQKKNTKNNKFKYNRTPRY